MLFKRICLPTLLTVTMSAYATGPYSSKIDKLQVADLQNPYNTVFLLHDITDSPCTSTNAHNRFAVDEEIQFSTILAAVMADKSITISGTGTCNAANVETIGTVTVRP